MTDDVETIASKLTPNMVRSLTWWCRDGYVSSEVDDATRRALVRRGLGSWSSSEVALTELGFDVRKVLLERQRVAKEAELQMLADQAAAERKIREEGYEDGVRFAERRRQDEVDNLLKHLQILVSRYPECSTIITFKEMKERSDTGVVVATPVENGYEFKVRQR